MAADITDDERRQVAERLRGGYDVVSDVHGRFWLNGTLFGMDITARGEEQIRDGLSRLADLIEPDTTSDTTKGIESDAFERGIDSIYDWCRERLEGADGAEDELYCAIMRAIEEYRHPELVTAHTVRAVDRGALLAVSEKMVNVANNMNYPVGMLRYMMRCDARRIREALGMAS